MSFISQLHSNSIQLNLSIVFTVFAVVMDILEHLHGEWWPKSQDIILSKGSGCKRDCIYTDDIKNTRIHTLPVFYRMCTTDVLVAAVKILSML